MENDIFFNIEKLVEFMEEKKKLNEYILIKKKLPNIEELGEIKIIEGKTYPVVNLINYFLTYLSLHELLHLQNDIPKNIFDYFCYDILNKKEIEEKKLLDIIISKEKIKNVINFDFSFKKFNLEENKKFTKGSKINNFSYCFNNNIENRNVLNIFLLDNINEKTNFLIKFNSITNIFVVDVLKMLCYIFTTNTIFKTIHDSMFKDSFNILCTDINLKKYKKIKNDLKNFELKNKNISSILNIRSFNNNDYFNSVLKNFQTELSCIIFTYTNSLIESVKTDIEITTKNNKTWIFLNRYLEI